GILHPTGTDTLNRPRLREVSEDLNPTIVGIGDENSVVPVDVYPRRHPEFTVAGAVGAENKEQTTGLIEYLHRVEQGIGDVDMSLAVDRDPFGLVQIPH